MNQITEQSIKEVGTIRIVKLSERKVRLDYYSNIICQEKVIETVKMKVRYLLDKEEGIYKMYYPKQSFLVKMSNSFRVKMKFIHYGTIFNHYGTVYGKQLLNTNDNFELDGLKFNNLIKSLYITDEVWFKEWNREKQLNELFK
jgi:hypothetical protein